MSINKSVFKNKESLLLFLKIIRHLTCLQKTVFIFLNVSPRSYSKTSSYSGSPLSSWIWICFIRKIDCSSVSEWTFRVFLRKFRTKICFTFPFAAIFVYKLEAHLAGIFINGLEHLEQRGAAYSSYRALSQAPCLRKAPNQPFTLWFLRESGSSFFFCVIWLQTKGFAFLGGIVNCGFLK